MRLPEGLSEPMKRKRGNTPKRKKLSREGRLRKAREWIRTYTGKRIIKGYARWFGVDWISALHELKLAGVKISHKEEQKIVSAYNGRIRQRRRGKELRKAKSKLITSIESEEEFGFDIVIGYTSGGFSYGIKSEPEIEHHQWAALYDEKFEEDDAAMETSHDRPTDKIQQIPHNMDTDDLSREAYKAVITEAEKFDHDLTLQFGVLASHCDNENEYLQSALELIEEIKALEPWELEDLFFGVMPDVAQLNVALDKMINNIAKVQRIPVSKRKYDF
jgi:hypothetical protein